MIQRAHRRFFGILPVMKEDNRSAIWGGATAGLIIGLVLGFFVGNYWNTVIKSVIVGIIFGVAANLLSFIGTKIKRQ